MNNKQKLVLLIGVLLLVLMGLIPPWKYTYDFKDYHSVSSAGYHLIMRPPAPRELVVTLVGPYAQYNGVSIDLTILLLQLGIVILVALGMVFVFQDAKAPSVDSDEQSSFFEIVTDGRFVQTTPGLPEMAVEEDELAPDTSKNIPQEVLSEDDL